MSKRKIIRLGDSQLQIMKVLWERGQASVNDVLDALGPDADLAYTTVATMLRRLEARGLVTHTTEGRTFVYRPAVAADEVSRSHTDHLVDRLFEGSLADMVSHLLATRDVSEAEFRKLEQLIAERRRKK
jgi:predicted transcriptional regulator